MTDSLRVIFTVGVQSWGGNVVIRRSLYLGVTPIQIAVTRGSKDTEACFLAFSVTRTGKQLASS